MDCGVVNIVTRQGELEGLKGAVNARLSQSHYTDADGSVMLTYGRGRFSASVFAFGSLNQVWTEEDVAYRYVQTRDLRLVGATYVQRVRDFDVQALATYRPTEHSSLNGQVSVSYAPNGQSVDGSTRYYGPDGVSEEARIRERNEIDEPEKRVAAHVEYLNTFGRPGTQLKLAADYYHGYATQEQDMRMDSILADGTTRPHAYYLDDAPQQSDVWSGEVRYTFPAGSKATLTVGGNGYKSVVDNNDRHRVWQDGGYVLDLLVSHDLQMDEWSVSALAQLSGTWNEHWTTMLSYQQKYRDYRSLMGSTGERYKRKFWEPQASASIVYKANPDHVLSYSGTYTMTAPDFNSLNPFRLYSSSTRYVEGNPYLLSAKLLYQSLRYQFLQKFMVGVNHFYVADGVESISSVDGDGLVVSRPENSLDNQGFHVYLSATGLSYAKERGSLTLTAALYGDYYRRDLRGEKQKQSDLGYAAGANHLFRLWPARQLQMVNTLTFYSKKNTGMWRTPAKLAFYTEVQKQAGDWNFSLSGFVTAHVMDKRMSLTNTSYYVEPTLYSENNTRNDGYYGCTLKVSYTFGNQKVRDVRRSESTNSEVRSRLK